MKKIIIIHFAVCIIAACAGAPPPLPPPPPEYNPNSSPELTVVIPELFSPDPDIIEDTITITIGVSHPVPIRDWQIEINRRIAGQAAPRQEPEQQGRQRQGGQRGAGQRSRSFFENSGTGNPPAEWKWNGKRTTGEMVQSATDYHFVLTVSDFYDNNTRYEGIISTDVLVVRDGDLLRIVVPSIVFPPNASDFALLNEEDRRSNNRVLSLIARALNRFDDYRVMVEGHANPTTPPGRQRDIEETGSATVIGLRPLSEARAKAVVDHLVNNNGINSERLSSTGMGGTRTVAAYNDADENWKNRRVEFILQR